MYSNKKLDSTVALERLIVLQDPALVNQPLLIGRNVAFRREDFLERSNGGFEANLNGELGAIRALDVDVDLDSMSAVGLGSVVHRTLTSSSHSRRCPYTQELRAEKVTDGSRRIRAAVEISAEVAADENLTYGRGLESERELMNECQWEKGKESRI